MATNEELLKRIEELESSGKWSSIAQWIVVPLISVAVSVGVTLYTSSEESKIQGIDVAQKMLPMIFVADPDEMVATKNLLLVVVDKPLGKVIEDIVNKRLMNQLNASLENNDTVAAAKIVVAAQSSSGAQSQSVMDTIRNRWQGSDDAAKKFVRAKQAEAVGYDKLDHGDFTGAKEAFENSKKEFPTFHAVDAISNVLENNLGQIGDSTVKRGVLDTIFKRLGDWRKTKQ